MAALLGLVFVLFGTYRASSSGVLWLALAAFGGVAGGLGVAAAVASWELLVRTPLGSALWLRVESFRRFLAESEGYHADQAAERGVLREYTAWAVAVGEIDRWRRAVTTAVTIPPAEHAAYLGVTDALHQRSHHWVREPRSRSWGLSSGSGSGSDPGSDPWGSGWHGGGTDWSGGGDGGGSSGGVGSGAGGGGGGSW